ncbi:MAG: DedA family protein [Polyangiales bacterium]
MALPQIVDVFLHVDKHLQTIISSYGTGTYLVLFAIVFCETGLVFLPFLPGDSLLFAAGAFAATGVLNVWAVLGLLMVAAILGDSVNYSIGTLLGPRLHARGKLPFVKKEHLDKTADFYERYGPKTLIIARFVPIVRTFAPFVAGIGSMKYGRFMTYNVVGAVAWATVCIFAGYFVGNMPIVKKNFEIVILLIIFISILPGIIGYLKERNRVRAEATGAAK